MGNGEWKGKQRLKDDRRMRCTRLTLCMIVELGMMGNVRGHGQKDTVVRTKSSPKTTVILQENVQLTQKVMS